MECSVDSLDDVPLKKPMFESTVIGDLAIKPQPFPVESHDCSPSRVEEDDVSTSPWLRPDEVDRTAELGQFTELHKHQKMDSKVLALCSQLELELELCPWSHHDNPAATELHPQLHHSNPAATELHPQLHHGNQAADLSSANLAPSTHVTKLDDNPTTQTLNPSDSRIYSGCELGEKDFDEFDFRSPNTMISPEPEHQACRVSVDREPSVASDKVYQNPRDIESRQLIAHSLSSVHIPQQMSVRMKNASNLRHEDAREETTSKNCSSTRVCTRKLSKLKMNPPNLSVKLETNLQHQDLDCINSPGSVGNFQTPLPSPVIKSRVNPHTPADHSAIHVHASQGKSFS